MRLFLFAVFYMCFHGDVPPAAAVHTDITAAYPLEPHLIGVYTGIKKLANGIN